MMSIIKTAIITIIISFISGLLLDYYRNLAPKILCTIKNNLISKYDKKIYTYIITISNISNKTIHELTLNIQSAQTNLKIVNSKITRGLKFTSSIKGNNLDISIPFLSKDDTFSITICAENEVKVFDKPFIVIRSPEKFKQIDSLKPSGILSSFSDKPKAAISNTVDDDENEFTKVMDNPLDTVKITPKKNRKKLYKNKRISKNKKILIVITSIILLVCIGFLGKYCYKVVTNMINTNIKTETPNKSTDAKDSSKDTDKKDINKSDKEATPNINSDSLPKQEDKTETPNKSTENINKDVNSNSVDKATDKNTSENLSNDNSTDNTNLNTSNENKNLSPSNEDKNSDVTPNSQDENKNNNLTPDSSSEQPNEDIEPNSSDDSTNN